MIKIEIENNGKNGRFVLYEDDEFAGEMTFIWKGKTIFIIEHTEVEEKFGGKGFAKKLVLKAVEYARENDLKIIPTCSYAKRVLESDESFEDVLG